MHRIVFKFADMSYSLDCKGICCNIQGNVNSIGIVDDEKKNNFLVIDLKNN